MEMLRRCAPPSGLLQVDSNLPTPPAAGFQYSTRVMVALVTCPPAGHCHFPGQESYKVVYELMDGAGVLPHGWYGIALMLSVKLVNAALRR